MKTATTATTSPMLPATKPSPLASAARGQPLGKEKQKGGGGNQRSPAHAELAYLHVAQQGLQPAELDAAQADAEALHQPPERARQAPPRSGSSTCSASLPPRRRARSGRARNKACGSSQGLSCHRPWNRPGA